MRLSLETACRLQRLAGLFCVCALGFAGAATAPSREGVALAIVFDTSGSMAESVRDKDGQKAPKYDVARRALGAVADRLESFLKAAAPGTRRELEVCLVVFRSGRPHEEIGFGPFDAERLRSWAKGFRSPAGGTPLGESMRLGARRVMASPLARKHVLVITDGINSVGPDPAAVLLGLRAQAERLQTVVAFHFIAFDVNASLFDPVKRLGATVVGAADEQQLGDQLQTILERKILLEDEEPAAASSATGGAKNP